LKSPTPQVEDNAQGRKNTTTKGNSANYDGSDDD